MFEKPAVTNEDVYRKRITAFMMVSLAPILAIAPYLIGLIGSALTPGCTNEANCSWAALPWFMFATIPLGFVLVITGIVQFFVSLRFKVTKTTEKNLRERKLNRYYFAWMATAAGPLLIALCGILSITGIAPASVATSLLVTGAAIYSVAWVYLLVVVVWNKLTR